MIHHFNNSVTIIDYFELLIFIKFIEHVKNYS